jgi:tryptophan synthase beta chain
MASQLTVPAAPGRFGPYGGRYVPETLMVPLLELEHAHKQAKSDPAFQKRFADLLKNFAGRPTPLQFAERLTKQLSGPRIYLKREDLLHTGAHKINNAIGQGLLAVQMGKPRVIAETGAGQHGVATATVAAHLGLQCTVYMGTEDMSRQALNVSRMKMLGAEVIGVNSGSCTLKDAINEAMRDWVTNVRTTHYLLGSVLGAHPYPTMVRDFHSCIGREARAQILAAENRLPTHLFACVGGGSNAIGLFHEFLKDDSVKMVGIEAGGRGNGLGEHAARLATAQGFTGARPGVLQGTYTYVLQTEDGQISTTHSISAGLDYPAIGPEHAWLADQGRAEYAAVSDDAALDAARILARSEGIIPALESAHAIAGLLERISSTRPAAGSSVTLSSAKRNEQPQRSLQANHSAGALPSVLQGGSGSSRLTQDHLVILNLSGRGDKDMATYSKFFAP